MTPNSDWKLTVTDNFPPFDFGVLLQWGITIKGEDVTTTTMPFEYDTFEASPGLMISQDTMETTTIESSGIIESSITDVNVYLNISHTFISDLSLFLTHETSGTEITLYDAACDGLCERNNIFAIIDDDDWAGDFCRVCEEEDCAACGGPYRPVDPLSTFDGLDPNSIWTLTFVDNFPAEDNGTLEYWRIDIASV